MILNDFEILKEENRHGNSNVIFLNDGSKYAYLNIKENKINYLKESPITMNAAIYQILKFASINKLIVNRKEIHRAILLAHFIHAHAYNDLLSNEKFDISSEIPFSKGLIEVNLSYREDYPESLLKEFSLELFGNITYEFMTDINKIASHFNVSPQQAHSLHMGTHLSKLISSSPDDNTYNYFIEERLGLKNARYKNKHLYNGAFFKYIFDFDVFLLKIEDNMSKYYNFM